MKTLMILIVLSAPALGADIGIKVATTTHTGADNQVDSTKDVVKRDGKIVLVRQSFTKSDQIRIHEFYHDGSLVATFNTTPDGAGFTVEAGCPFVASLELDAKKDPKSVSILSKDGVILEGFTYSKGDFSPVESSVIKKSNAFTAEAKRLFDPEHVSKTPPGQFGKEAVELAKKYQQK